MRFAIALVLVAVPAAGSHLILTANARLWARILGAALLVLAGMVLFVFWPGRLSERALRRSEEKYRRLFEESRDALYVTAVDGAILEYNRAFQELFGYTREELAGKKAGEFYARAKDRRAFQAAVEREGAVTDYEVTLVGKDGCERDCLLSASVRRSDDGSTVGYQGSIRDISERKSLERQFFLVQKLEAVGRLAGGLAHDFNNLLTAILGNCAFLLSDLEPGDPRRPEVEEIEKAGERAAALTRQLLAFSRRQVLQPQVLDLNEVIGGVNKLLERLIGEDIEVVTSLAPDLGRVKADPGQIEQVIVNLAVNARDAMPEGGVLTVETSNVDINERFVRGLAAVESGPYVVIAVSDTGCGMDEATRAQIFEPFFTTKEKGKGTGLGLSTVYGIVKQSGGYVWAYSEPGLGTTFRVYLPRVDEAVTPRRASDAATPTPRGSETVVLVEDDETVRSTLLKGLTRFGYSVLAARDGDQAFELLDRRNGEVDLLITDLVLPQASGPQVAERAAQLYPAVKVIYVSGYTEAAAFSQGLLEPDTPFLQKPFDAETLARKVREVLDAG